MANDDTQPGINVIKLTERYNSAEYCMIDGGEYDIACVSIESVVVMRTSSFNNQYC